MKNHYLVFRGNNPDSVAECARYAGVKTVPAKCISVLKPKGILIIPWVDMNTKRAATFGVSCEHVVESKH